MFSTVGNYFKDDYNALEMNMVKLFDWDFNVPTALTFGLYYAEFVVDVADFFSNFGICYANFKEFKEEMKHKVIGFVDVSLFGKYMSCFSLLIQNGHLILIDYH